MSLNEEAERVLRCAIWKIGLESEIKQLATDVYK